MSNAIAVTLTRRAPAWAGARTDAILVVSGSLVVAALAQVAVVLPFTPVPITGQTLGVLLAGASLGAVRGGLALLLYLAEGLCGLPFFAGGAGGPAALAGPTGGYLVGFVGAAFLVGWLAERGWDRRVPTALAAFAAGQCVIYLVGLAWLANFVGRERVLTAGLWPFLPGAALKMVAAAMLLPFGWKIARR